VRRSDVELVAAARAHLAALRRHLERGDLTDDTIVDAVCMRLSAAIESVAMVDDERRSRAYGEVWPAIWSVRNRIAHGYVFVDRAIMTATVANDLGGLEEGLRAIELDVAPPSDPPTSPT
jgi:uncharacterized protein with HEPN domain